MERFGILTRASAWLIRGMRFNGNFSVAVVASPLVVGSVAFLCAPRSYRGLAFADASLIVFLSIVLLFARGVSLRKQYQAAADEGDADGMARYRALIDGPTPPTMPAEIEWRKVGVLEELMVRCDWERARDHGEDIDRKLIPSITRQIVIANIARATALAGDPLRGHMLLSEAVNAAEEMGEQFDAARWSYLDASRGIIMSLLERHEVAVEILEPIHGWSSPRLVAMNAFYLGRSLRAVGREEDAKAVFGMGSLLAGRFAQLCDDEHDAMEAPTAESA